MTQKELLYLEDAVKHEENIIKICEEIINLLVDKKLASFVKKEVKQHEKMKNELINILEVKCNE